MTAYRMSRVHLAAFVASLLIWLAALGAMAVDSPNPDVWTPATAPGVEPTPLNDGGRP